MAHTVNITTRGYHCDAYGHVNNARYLEFLEEARWQYLEDGLGLDYWCERGLGFVVAEAKLRYKRPIPPNTELEIISRTGSLEGRKGIFFQVIVDRASRKTAVEAEFLFAVINLQTGRAVDMAGEVKAGFETMRANLDEASE